MSNLNQEQFKAACELNDERSKIVRELRKISERYEYEFNGPDAKLCSLVYRAAADLIDKLTYQEFCFVAEASVVERIDTSNE